MSPLNLAFSDRELEAIRRHLQPFGRRALLRGGSIGLVATGLTACSGSTVATPAGIKHLGSQYAIFDQLIKTFMPIPRGSRLVTADKVPVRENIDTLYGGLPADIRHDLGQGLTLLNYGAILIGFHLKPFVSLEHSDAVAYCRSWQSGRSIQRSLMWVLKQFVFLSYWREPVTWAAIEYDGPVSRRLGTPRQGNSPLPDPTILVARKP